MHQALDWDILSIRFIAWVIGKIVSSLPGSEYGKLHYRNLERDKIRALALNRGDYDGRMQLSVLAKRIYSGGLRMCNKPTGELFILM